MAHARGSYYWEQHIDEGGAWRVTHDAKRPAGPSGQELAALRRGIGRDAGTVPELWPFYQTVNRDDLGRSGQVSEELKAEHVSLSLYATHQQSQAEPMHRHGRGLGQAVRQLRNTDALSAEAVDRRFNAAATATSPNELGHHLRSLVTLLRGQQIPLDYTRLLTDLAGWAREDSRSRTRRRWGNDYYGWSKRPSDAPLPLSTPTH